jgi:tetratricopeptide (TPR) repeat protein
LLAEYYLWRDNNDAAERELAVALRLAPNRPEVLRITAKVNLNRGLLLPAIEAARAAMAASPGDRDAAELAARIYVAQARQAERSDSPDQALASLFAASALLPDSPLPPLLIGRVLLRVGLPRAARADIELGRRRLGDPSRAPQEAFAVEAISPEDDAATCLRMAEFYRERHQPDAAESQLALALAADCRLVEAWRMLGLLRAKELGDPIGARLCLSALWILDPEGPGARELEALLGLKDEPDAPPSPGYVVRAQIGAGYSAAKRAATDEAAAFPAGARLYFVLALGRAAGRHTVRWQALDGQGRAIGEQAWDAELFEREFAFVTTGAWGSPGRYEAVWSMDGAERKRLTFELK